MRIVAATVAVLVGAIVLGPVPPASAGPDPVDHIKLLSIRYAVARDGTIDVTETIDYIFRADNHTGRLSREYPSRERSRTDSGKDQVWQYTDFAASSPTGAATELTVGETYLDAEYGDSSVPTRVARMRVRFPYYDGPDRIERYVLTYRLRGALRPDGLRAWPVAHLEPTLTERTEVVVTAPGGVRAPACETGDRHPCTATLGPGGEARFTAGRLEYDKLLVTFTHAAVSGPGVGPILVDPPAPRRPHVGVAGALAGAGAVALLLVPLIWWGVARAIRGMRRGGALTAAARPARPARPARTGLGRIVVALACALVGVAAGFAGGILVLIFTAELFGSGLAGAVLGMAVGPLFTVVVLVWLFARTGLGGWFGVLTSVLVVGSAIGMGMGSSAWSVSIGFAAPVLLGVLAYLTDPAHRHRAG